MTLSPTFFIQKVFLPAAKPSGPRTVRVVVLVGGDQFAKVHFSVSYGTLLPTQIFLWGGILCSLTIFLFGVESIAP